MTPEVKVPPAAVYHAHGEGLNSAQIPRTLEQVQYDSPGRTAYQLLTSKKAENGSYSESDKTKISNMLLVRANSIMDASEAEDYLKIANEIRAINMPALADTLECRANCFLQRSEDVSIFKQTNDKNRSRAHNLLDELEGQIKGQIKEDNYQSLAKTADRLYDILNYTKQINISIDESIKQRLEYIAEQARNAQIHPPKRAVSFFGKVKNVFKSILFK